MTLLSRQVFGNLPHLIQEELTQVGIQIDVKVLPDSSFFERLKSGEATFWLNRYACSTGDAGDFLDDVLHSRDPEGFFGSYNYGRYSNIALDQAIEQVAGIELLSVRGAAIQEILQTAATDHIIVPLFMDQDIYTIDASFRWPPRADSYVLAAEIGRDG